MQKSILMKKHTYEMNRQMYDQINKGMKEQRVIEMIA